MDINTAAKKSKYGRKALLPDLKRSYQFKVGFTQSEYKKLAAQAEQAGIAESELIRKFALSKEVKTPSQINKFAYAELAKLANNLNQLARVANHTGIIESHNLIMRTFESVQSLRQQLLGTQ